MASLALATAQEPLAYAATAQPKAKGSALAALPTNLRGVVAPDRPLAPRSISPATGPLPGPISPAPKPLGSISGSPAASTLASAKPDEGQCRSGCAHTYYFCLSGELTTDCAPTWSQCLSDCSHPPLSIDR